MYQLEFNPSNQSQTNDEPIEFQYEFDFGDGRVTNELHQSSCSLGSVDLGRIVPSEKVGRSPQSQEL